MTNKRTNFEEIANIALLYREKYEGTTMLNYEKVVDYYNQINTNLYIMGTISKERKIKNINDNIYFIALDENNNKYLVIDPKTNLKEAWSKYFDNLPLDILMASKLYNSLSTIGIKLTEQETYQKKRQK